MKPTPLFALALLTLPLAGCSTSNDAGPAPEENGTAGPPGVNPVAVMAIRDAGTIRLELFADRAPQTVKNFGELATNGYYDGVKFHRVIGPSPQLPSGFMIQGGDPLTKDDSQQSRWGTGGPGYTILDEFACADGHTTNAHPADCELAASFDRAGLLAMANVGSPRTGGSQFFITLGPTDWLDGRHTIFGRVVDGMKVVRTIGNVTTDAQDRPTSPVVIQRLTIEGALPDVELQKFPG
ncbi:MAG: peptidylprolyl isomerase [bacterium]